MLQAGHSLPTGTFCLKLVRSVLCTCPTTWQCYAMALIDISCHAFLECVWAGFVVLFGLVFLCFLGCFWGVLVG